MTEKELYQENKYQMESAWKRGYDLGLFAGSLWAALLIGLGLLFAYFLK